MSKQFKIMTAVLIVIVVAIGEAFGMVYRIIPKI